MTLAIYGAGGMGAEFLRLAEIINEKETRWNEIVFVDDASRADSFLNHPLYMMEQIKKRYTPEELEFTISVGEPILREKMGEKVKIAGYLLATLIHPSHSRLPHGVVLEEGAVLMTPLVGVGSFAHIGKNVLLQGYSNVGHNTCIGDNSNVSCFVQISGGCKIGKNVFFGIQSVVKEGITIGDNAIIGMCAPVLRDVPENYTVFHAISKMVPHEPGTRALGGNYN